MLDPSRQLPSYSPGDPRKDLSREAQVRIQDAGFRADFIRKLALAKIMARCPDEWDSTAQSEWATANMDAAFAESEQLVQELMRIGVGGCQLFKIMEEWVQGVAYSLELSQVERDAVLAHLYTVRVPAQELARKASVGRQSIESIIEIRARREAVVRPLLKAKGLSVYRWEQDAGVTSKVGQRYLDGHTLPRSKGRCKLAKMIGLEDLPR